MKQIEQTISSVEVAEMIGKRHADLMREICRYLDQVSEGDLVAGELGRLKIKSSDFFKRTTYKDSKDEPHQCFNITKKGCEFIAHKLTGVKGTAFTAQYIKRFYDLEDSIQQGIHQGEKQQYEHLDSVNNAVKILTPMLKAAGCDSKIQLLTAKTLYERAGVELPLLIETDQQYYDTVYIARHVGIYYRSSGKPADKAVNEIIRRLKLADTLYTETWEQKGNWQGVVRKYTPQVINMVRQWYYDNGYPQDIEYIQCDGQKKYYHVIWRQSEVA